MLYLNVKLTSSIKNRTASFLHGCLPEAGAVSDVLPGGSPAAGWPEGVWQGRKGPGALTRGVGGSRTSPSS